METIISCPICGSQQIKEGIKLKDFFFTQEAFSTSECVVCGLIFTNPRPEPERLGAYYKTEDYVSHSDTKAGLVNKVYHYIRKKNFKKKYKLIQKFSGTDGKLLDVGCATGGFLNFFKERGWEVSGIEPDADARTFTQKNYGIEVNDEAFLNNLPAKSFDVITMWHVLEHVPHPVERLKILHEILKDDGLLVIAIPNPGSYDAQKYKEFWAGYDVPRHLLHFKQEVALKFFDQNQFDCIEVVPMKYDAYYISLLSEKYIHGGNHYFKAFKSGLASNRYAKRNLNNYSSLIYMLRKK
jgi:2-polyprenyl-3-methyl-5-hydroxy-6-metoxy-1,4-benzoquinol methylase